MLKIVISLLYAEFCKSLAVIFSIIWLIIEGEIGKTILHSRFIITMIMNRFVKTALNTMHMVGNAFVGSLLLKT